MQRDPAMPFKKILCAVDFSDTARLAARRAAELALELDAELVLVHVWQSPLLPERGEDILQNELLAPIVKEQEACLDKAVQDARAVGLERVTKKLLYGVPWDAIVRETRDDPAYDLVVMGTHGRTGIKQVLLGSVAERVARHASCPVLLVRAKAGPSS